MRQHAWRLSLACLLLLATACGPGLSRSGPALEQGVRVVVDNQGTSSLEVRAISNSSTARLGTVQPVQTADFRVPAGILGVAPYQVQVAVGPSGSSETIFATPPLTVQPGQEIELTVEESVRASTWRVR